MRRAHLLLALVGVFCLPRVAYPEAYAVRSKGGAEERAKMGHALAAYRASGLHVYRELVNLSDTVTVEATPALARLLAEEGYEVELLPPRRAVEVPWSLDRDNQRHLPLDGDTSHPYRGEGVRIFILDSGIYQNGDEFGDRLSATDYVGDGLGPFATCGLPYTHATGVASVAAGSTDGVAPGASIYLMRILKCDGFVWGPAYSAAMDDIVTWRRANPTVPAIVNMSFAGVGRPEIEDRFLKLLSDLGVILVDGAGNDNADACLYGPAGSPYTITAAGSTIEDRKADFSNWGSCVDLFAPALGVPAVIGNDPTVAAVLIGTSASAPAVAGTIALYLEEIPDLTAAEARKALVANATAGALTGDLGKGSPNLVLYDGALHEEVSRLIPRWFPVEHRFTTQVAVTMNGNPTPFASARLFRGPAKDGHCQGQPFATVTLSNGSGVSSIVGWKQAPAFVCVETRAGTVYERFVRTLN